jgi:hypothetical protein
MKLRTVRARLKSSKCAKLLDHELFRRLGLAPIMHSNDDLLRTVERHAEEVQQMVSEQKGRVTRLRAAGKNTLLAETTR